MRLAEKLKEKRTTPYKEVAEKFGVTAQYVGENSPRTKSSEAEQRESDEGALRT